MFYENFLFVPKSIKLYFICDVVSVIQCLFTLQRNIFLNDNDVDMRWKQAIGRVIRRWGGE